jgi:PKD repeat protein
VRLNLGRKCVTRRARLSRMLAALCPALALVWVLTNDIPIAAAASLSPYGEVERFGGFDTSASYGPATTRDLGGAVGEQARFVYPIGMEVDTEDPTAPDNYSIYVLENVNPQALNTGVSQGRTASTTLEYRIQKLSERGEVLASRTFTLASSSTEEDLHAVSLAVDGAEGRVYVLIADAPEEGSGDDEHGNAAVRIDAWTTALAPADGGGELPEDKLTHAGELAGPDTAHPLQGTGPGSFVGDIDGESIAVDGVGADADLALAGNKYTSAFSTIPVIERIKTAGADAGELDGEWKAAGATEDAAAKARGQVSESLYAMSADPGDEALNVTLGPEETAEVADDEPNMATVSPDLGSTTTRLPWADAQEDNASHLTSGEINSDRAATDGFRQDAVLLGGSAAFQPSGATVGAGTLAPSVVELAGDGAQFPKELYAGLVVSGGGGQDPRAGSEPSWRVGGGVEDGETLEVTKAPNLGIRIFDAGAAGEEEASLGMIGNATPSGPCNLEGGFDFFNFIGRQSGSFVALAPGRDGVLFALVQPDLVNTTPFAVNGSGEQELISPASSIGADTGDQIVEFAPGSASSGAGENAAKWRECPQPAGAFSTTDKTTNTQDAGLGSLTVPVNTTLAFDASEADTRGGAVWAYDWDLENGAAGGIAEHSWTVNNEFGATPEQGKAWEWPSPTVEHTYATPGAYKAKLNLVSDFGTLTAEREIRVAKDEPITGVKITPASGTSAGAVALTASATVPQFDSIVDYHWEFGDGQGEDTKTAETEHVYAAANEYGVKLTVTDALGQHESAEVKVAVVPPPVVKKEEPSPTPGGTTTPISTPPAVIPPVVKPVVVAPKPLTNAQKLAKALKACKKLKSKRKRVSCEAQAKRRYAPPKKKKKGH